MTCILHMNSFVQESMFTRQRNYVISKKGYGCKWKLETVQHYIHYSTGTTLVLLFYIPQSQQSLQQ
jgi:hypothetical protein